MDETTHYADSDSDMRRQLIMLSDRIAVLETAVREMEITLYSMIQDTLGESTAEEWEAYAFKEYEGVEVQE